MSALPFRSDLWEPIELEGEENCCRLFHASLHLKHLHPDTGETKLYDHIMGCGGAVVRMTDSQSREHGSDSPCCHFDSNFVHSTLTATAVEMNTLLQTVVDI